MKFECHPPDNEVFFDCGMEPISVRKCPNNPQCPSIGKKQTFCLKNIGSVPTKIKPVNDGSSITTINYFSHR